MSRFIIFIHSIAVHMQQLIPKDYYIRYEINTHVQKRSKNPIEHIKIIFDVNVIFSIVCRDKDRVCKVKNIYPYSLFRNLFIDIKDYGLYVSRFICDDNYESVEVDLSFDDTVVINEIVKLQVFTLEQLLSVQLVNPLFNPTLWIIKYAYIT